MIAKLDRMLVQFHAENDLQKTFAHDAMEEIFPSKAAGDSSPEPAAFSRLRGSLKVNGTFTRLSDV